MRRSARIKPGIGKNIHVRWHSMRLPMIAVALALLLASVAHTQQPRNSNSDHLAGNFTDVTSSLGIQFEYLATHTSKKYLIETMGSGVALFDYDNDRRLDIFVVNGAPLNDPTPVGTLPQKTGP